MAKSSAASKADPDTRRDRTLCDSSIGTLQFTIQRDKNISRFFNRSFGLVRFAGGEHNRGGPLRNVRRHLHLVDCAYACLTHLAIKDQRAQGQQKNKNVLRLPTMSQLKTRMRQLVWQEAVQDVVKHSHEKPVIRRLEKLLAA